MQKVWRWGAVILIIWLATYLRFHLLEAQSFWNDEGNSARLSERSVQLIIEGTASDIHPPLYYLLLRGWRELVGETEFGLRAFSAFAGVGMVAFSFGVGRALTQRGKGATGQSAQDGLIVSLGTAVFVAVNPALIYYSQETRMYALLGLWAVWLTWLLLLWWKRPSRTNAIAYVLVAAAGLYTQYFFPTVLVAHNTAVLIWLIHRRASKSIVRQRLGQWVGMMVAALLLYAPWLPIFWVQFSSEPVQRPPLLPFLQDVGRWLLFGATIEAAGLSWVIGAAFVLLLLGVVNGRWQSILPGLLIVVPVVFMVGTGTTGPEFFKFLVVSSPMVALLLAFSLLGSRPVRWGRWIALLLLLAMLPVNWQSLVNMYHNPAYARDDYRWIAGQIQAEANPNAGIILEAANQWEVFTYYFPDDARVYPFPKGRSLPKADDIDADLTAIAAQHDRLYALYWGEAQRDPERLVERWLDAHTFKAAEVWVGDVRFVTYAVPAAAAGEMETTVSMPFGEHIQLNGYTLRESTLQPGEIVQITLFWQAAQSVDTRYKVFLHLLDFQGGLVAQRDSEPGGGLALTTTWPPDEVVVDNHGVLLPVDLPAGTYSLVLGLYDAADPSRRLPVGEETAVTDHLLLSTINVEEP